MSPEDRQTREEEEAAGITAWLAREAMAPPQPQQLGNEFIKTVFQLTAVALRTADRDVTLEADVEVAALEAQQALVASGVPAARASAFTDAVITIAATSLGASAESIRALLGPVLQGLIEPGNGAPMGIPLEVGVTKLDLDQQLVTGWASVIENPDGSPLEDHQGDIITEQDLMEAAHAFMKERGAGEMHRRVEGVGTVVESVVVTKALKQALGLPASTPTGWLVTIKVDDPAVWAKVRSGEYAMLSVGGTGTREPWLAPVTKSLFDHLRSR
jgi:hypothetical protein